jgi:predicted phosphodiesterase
MKAERKRRVLVPLLVVVGVYLIVLTLGFSEAVAVSVMRKGPYLIYPGDNTKMMILWQLDSSEICSLGWGLDTSYSIGNTSSQEYGTDHQHKHIITDLSPGTKYYYYVKVGEDVYTGTFLTAPATDAKEVRFLAYGDTRSNPKDHDNVCAAIVDTYTTEPGDQTFLLHTGDFVKNGDLESDWTTQYFGWTWSNTMELQANVPVQACMGNHEEDGILYAKYLPYPFVRDHYWSFDYGPVHIVIVDQYDSYRITPSQLTWIENDLRATTKAWKLIVLHEPGWSAYGKHTNNSDVQTRIQPLCEAYGVDIVFAGHNHYYARAEVNKVMHVTTGGGGAPLRTPVLTSRNVITALDALHFCRIDIRDNQLAFKAVRLDGTVIDKFFIIHPNKQQIKMEGRAASQRSFFLLSK